MRRGSCAYFGGGGPKLECYGTGSDTLFQIVFNYKRSAGSMRIIIVCDVTNYVSNKFQNVDINIVAILTYLISCS